MQRMWWATTLCPLLQDREEKPRGEEIHLLLDIIVSREVDEKNAAPQVGLHPQYWPNTKQA